ncbi:outer membrane protein with beta-barrel domain [Edaphobacter aggregans]|uniref:Outer membrane protein with beta-barrel domain n=1 Tax=Edaphobacter aggregans TaxID=570835 RepID=A0A428MG66_9BACT|nr:outer membrane beta-barrel protein [Edaphobacter aggregans]RSL15981.1 outer membrane protein with beta-barrel domain [Edaphobacter aggregans]
MKRHSLIGCFTCLLGLSSLSHAQAVPTAERRGILQLGGGLSIASPDYSPLKIKGLSAYGTYDFTRHIGLEGDIHYVSLSTPGDLGEDSYLIGPRYVFHHPRVDSYVKALGGFGRFSYLGGIFPTATYTYKIYAFGGGLDVRASRHINVRAIDLEYQQWPGFPTNGLTPLVATIGAAYAFR